MFKNYLKIAWRNLKKNKVFSIINILGLTIGITCCMMIFLFIMNEFSVDRFHKQKTHIYRAMRGFEDNGNVVKVPYLSPPYATALLNDYPDAIKAAVRVMPANGLVSFDDHSFNEKKLFVADASFFTVFSFPLLKGNAATVLNDPASVVLTETTAKKYFGSQDPMGKTIVLDKERQLKVTGIARDVPSNSHLDFDLVIPLSNYANAGWFGVWNNNNLFTYVLLNDHASWAQMEKQLKGFMEKYMGPDMARSGTKAQLTLTPMSDIYFEPASPFDNVKHGDKTVVYIFLSIAILILLIACINFMNLSTIRAVERSKEVGLRKVLGALRQHLVGQFIGESVLLTLISCVLAVGLLQLLMPVYNQLLGYSLTISWMSLPIYLFLAGVILVVGLVAGSYPAFFLSAFSPIQALKGKLKIGKGGSIFRQALVVVQFSISVLLIIGTIIIMRQMSFVKNKELGFEKEHTVLVKIDNDDIYRQRDNFKNELQSNSNIASVSLMSGEPGGFYDMHSFEVEGRNEPWKARTNFADFEIVKALGLKIIAGRNFSPQFVTDSTDAVLINHTAAKDLGYTPEQALGKWIQNIYRDSARRRIVGVVEDFNFLSLKEQMDPLVIAPNQDRRVAVIKLKAGDVNQALAAVEKVYHKVAPVYPFEYSFLDQKFDVLYKKDLRQQTLITVFSALAIFIACLGLFGLASFTATKRTKEIGVRKVLGASEKSIVALLSKEFIRLVGFALLIAFPLAWWAMHRWLENFAYRISISWWMFAVAGILVILVAFITVSFQSIKAAVANPVNSLRSE
jgi:putative ABC transport system permease protein